MSKLIRFFKFSNRRKLYLIEAAILSGFYRFRITHRPIKEMSHTFGTFQYETEEKELPDAIPKDVAWAVSAMSYHVQWNTLCLDRALAAKKMLNRRGYPCTLYLGLIQDPEKGMVAHAWLRCGKRWVSGGSGKGYAITGIYGDEWEKTKGIPVK